MTDAHDLSAGDKVSWKWGAGEPSGTVEEVVDGDASITTNRGNEVSRHGDEENPAVKIKTDSGNSAIKKASELVGIETGKRSTSDAKGASTASKQQDSKDNDDDAGADESPETAQKQDTKSLDGSVDQPKKKLAGAAKAAAEKKAAENGSDADDTSSDDRVSKNGKGPTKKLSGAAKKAADDKAAKAKSASGKRKAPAQQASPAKRTRRANKYGGDSEHDGEASEVDEDDVVASEGDDADFDPTAEE